MASLLARVFRGRGPEREPFRPARLGPACRLAEPGRVEVTSGPLAGSAFGLRVELKPGKADFYLAAGGETEPVAHTHFDRDPDTGLETEWDIFVRADYRGKGLTGLLVRLSYRHLLGLGGRRWFAMRKLMQVDSSRRELHNIGIGIIGVRIGLRPEPALEEILTGRAVKSVRLIAAHPPGLFIELRRLPGVVVAAEFDEAGRPRPDLAHYRRLTNPVELARAARAGRAIVGNIDYFLDRGQVEHFCRHFADTATEYKTWLRALRAGERHRHN